VFETNLLVIIIVTLHQFFFLPLRTNLIKILIRDMEALWRKKRIRLSKRKF